MADVLEGVPSARANEWMCALYIVVSRRSYVAAHVADQTAACIAAPDHYWRRALKEQPEKLGEDLSAWSTTGNAQLSALRSRLITSASLATGAFVVALVAGVAAGVVGAALPVSVPKVMLFVGTTLMAWATIFGLGAPVDQWDGPALPDRVVPKLFLTIFVPGAALALSGALF